MDDKFPYTHRATITLSSNEENPDVAVEVNWFPDIEGKTIKDIGYLPAAYQFVQQYILPALEDAYMLNEHEELMDSDSPPKRLN